MNYIFKLVSYTVLVCILGACSFFTASPDLASNTKHANANTQNLSNKLKFDKNPVYIMPKGKQLSAFNPNLIQPPKV